MKQILFFAHNDDIVSVLNEAEREKALKYVRMGQLPTATVNTFTHGADIPNLGKASADSTSKCESFLVTEEKALVNLRRIRTNGDTERFLIDQLANHDSVTFTPAGLWNTDIVIYGRVATVSDSAPSQELMKLFNAAFRKKFIKVKAFWVGPAAIALLHSGKRLTISAQSPRDFDLTLPASNSGNHTA